MPATWPMPSGSSSRRGACSLKIPGLVLRDLPETGFCCGSAGTYNLNRPEMAQRLARRKVDNIAARGPKSYWRPTPVACCRLVASCGASRIPRC